jgi:hypothetical protein
MTLLASSPRKSGLANIAVRIASVGVSGIALTWALVEPASLGSTSYQMSAAVDAVRIPPLTVVDTTSDGMLERAVERDPFTSADRSGNSSATTPPPAVPNEQSLRVLGTVVDSAGGSFALCQLGVGQAAIVRIGQRIGDYELRRVQKGSVVFTTPDGGSVELRVPRAGA